MSNEQGTTTDLGHGWFATTFNNGTMTIRNADKGQRINLDADSVARLRGLCAQDTATQIDAEALEQVARRNV